MKPLVCSLRLREVWLLPAVFVTMANIAAQVAHRAGHRVEGPTVHKRITDKIMKAPTSASWTLRSLGSPAAATTFCSVRRGRHND